MTLSVLDAARDAPEGVAWLTAGAPATYGALAERIAPRIRWLESESAETPLCVLGKSDADTLLLLYACFELGRPVALVHPRLTESERARVSSVVGARYIEAPHLESGGEFVPARPLPDPESCLAVLFTSGTTGEPKGVELSRRAFLASAQASGRNLPLSPGDRWLLGLPIAHVGGLSVLTRSLLARSTVVVPGAVSRGERLDAKALRRTLEEDGVTIASLVPTQLEWLLSEGDCRPPPALRAVLLGGAAARPALLARAADRGFPVLTTYGLTEACSQVTTQVAGTVNRGELGAGTPMPGTEVKLADGTVCVRGPTLLTRYLTARGPVNPLDADGFFHTDDIGRLDEGGRLHVLGRSSDKIVTGGENVFPAEVEAVLEQAPGVTAACVFGVADATWGEVVAAALVPSAAGAPPLDALREFVATRLGQHRRPRLVTFVEGFEIAPSGKLDRKGTRARASASLVPLAG